MTKYSENNVGNLNSNTKLSQLQKWVPRVHSTQQQLQGCKCVIKEVNQNKLLTAEVLRHAVSLPAEYNKSNIPLSSLFLKLFTQSVLEELCSDQYTC